ncbi:MAG: dihydropteroate synthase [Pseudomonadota bacterium]
MIDPNLLRKFWERHADALESEIKTFSLGSLTFEDRAYQMGVINLSRDSPYRESVCLSVEQALYRGRRMQLEGASLVDVGAESSVEATRIVGAEEQQSLLLPVVDALVGAGVPVSVETYHLDVADAVLDRGACVINLTGRMEDDHLYRAIARHGAGVIICYMAGRTVRDEVELPTRDALVERQLAYFREQLELALNAGVERIWIDPGFGFSNRLPDGPARVAYQIESMLQAFRFRVLGWPTCVQLASPLAMFREEIRCAETCFATLAMLSKANLLRTHESARVQPVIAALSPMTVPSE